MNKVSNFVKKFKVADQKLKDLFDKGNITCKTLVRPIAHSIMPNSPPADSIHYLNHTMMLMDAWVGDKEENDNEFGLVFLRFKPSDLLKWEERYDKFLKTAPTFIRRYRKDEHKILVYRFPEEWMSDYKHVMNSEYSKVSSEYINKFYSKDSFLYHVKNKTKVVKEYYGEQFNVPVSIFSDCEIGNKFLEQNEYL